MAYGALIRSGDGSTVCGALTWRGMVPPSVGQRSDSCGLAACVKPPEPVRAGGGAPTQGK